MTEMDELRAILFEAERIAGDLLTHHRKDGETIRSLIDFAATLSPAGVTEEQVDALTKKFCGDKLNGGVLRDMAFTVWQKCQKPTHEDGNTDWFNDTLPVVDAAVEQLRAALEAAAKAQPRDYTDFDTWFHEQEGTSLRSERFNGDVEWLKAAFDAGRSAQPSISTGQGEPAYVQFRMDALRLATEMVRTHAPVLFEPPKAGTVEALAHDIAVVFSAYEWAVTDEGHVVGLVAGDHGYSMTSIKAHIQPSLPAGHVAVPVEPTEEMKSSGMDVLMHRGDIYARDDGTVVIETITPADLWAAMLAARPHNQGEGK